MFTLPVLVFLAISSSAVAQSDETFKVRLSPTPIDAVTKNTITGSGSLTAVLAGNKLTVTGTFERMRSPATDVHIHQAAKGIRGPAILRLNISKGTSGEINGSVQLTPSEVEDLKSGRLYVQINSERAPAPDGNLWGWLLR
jgi:hypothetical protein